MTQAIPIYQGQDFFVPYFEVKLHGNPLRPDVIRDILSVSYKDSVTEIDSFEIVINNWDAEARSFKFSDDDLFDPGQKVELWMGYYGKDRLRLMITGEITSLKPSFPASGQPTLTISGLNLLHHLRTKQNSATYEEKTDSEIAQEIGQRLNVTVRTDPTASASEERYKYLFQDHQYDILFLMERARRIGYDLFVEESGDNGASNAGSLYFGPSVNLHQVTYQLTYGRSMIEFQPELSTAKQVDQVTVQGWDQIKNEKIEHTATRNDIKTKGVGDAGGQSKIDSSFSGREEVIVDRPIQSAAEAKTLAVETLERIAKNMLKGHGATVGLPDLRAGSILMIDGLGTRFSGRYFVTATAHTIGDSGYNTQFDCRREEL